MAVISPINSAPSWGEKGARAYTAVWQVYDTVNMLGIQAINHLGIMPYDTYWFGLADGTFEYDTIARAVSISAAKSDRDARQWLVTIQYRTIEMVDDNPLNVPWQTNISFNKESYSADSDIYGNPVINRAGDPFQTAVEATRSICIVSITRNEATANANLSIFNIDKLNIYSFMGFPKGCVCLRDRSIASATDPKYGIYAVVTYSFEFNINGFSKRILNCGLREKLFIRGAKWIRAMCQIRGKDATSPVNLDMAGRAQGPNDTPIFLTFEMQDYADFSVFGLV